MNLYGHYPGAMKPTWLKYPLLILSSKQTSSDYSSCHFTDDRRKVQREKNVFSSLPVLISTKEQEQNLVTKPNFTPNYLTSYYFPSSWCYYHLPQRNCKVPEDQSVSNTFVLLPALHMVQTLGPTDFITVPVLKDWHRHTSSPFRPHRLNCWKKWLTQHSILNNNSFFIIVEETRGL